jgi:hypothetical protein
MRVTILLLALAVTLGGCARGCESNKRETMGKRKYEVEVWSGDSLIHTYRFTGILNNQDNSDGYYWFQGDTLYEVSGTTIVRAHP